MRQFVWSNIDLIVFGIFFAIIMLLWSIKNSLAEIKTLLIDTNYHLSQIEDNTDNHKIDYTEPC